MASSSMCTENEKLTTYAPGKAKDQRDLGRPAFMFILRLTLGTDTAYKNNSNKWKTNPAALWEKENLISKVNRFKCPVYSSNI